MLTARRLLRKLRASWRDTLLLLRQFRWPLLWFILTIMGSGFLYYYLALQVGRPLDSLGEAFYHTLTLAFLQPTIPFPHEWYLQLFYFVLPIVGVGILAHGLADFGILFFNRRARGKEWEMAVASTMNNHVILIGLGHLGFRVVKKLRDLEQEIVVVELSPDPDLLQSILSMDVPVIQDDGTREAVLKAAGVGRARAIILCTQNDSLNLRMALKARNLNPKIEVVIRIFDDEFAESLEKQFGFHAMSATGMAAPLFASIAAQINITPPIMIGGHPHILADLSIQKHSRLAAKSILALEEKYQISIIMLCKGNERIFHPPADEIVNIGQTIAVFGDPDKINLIMHENHR